MYAVYVYLGGKRYEGMLNIGSCPTVHDGDKSITVEVHILDFEKDIYQETIKVEFIYYIRPEVKFENVEELTLQLQKDKIVAKKLLDQKE